MMNFLDHVPHAHLDGAAGGIALERPIQAGLPLKLAGSSSGIQPSAPALEPSEGEQDERYDERTDPVLDGDVSGARLESRDKKSPRGASLAAGQGHNRPPRRRHGAR
jgi:hypothetical protein